MMTPFDVTVLPVTFNAAWIVPSANNRFSPPNVIGNLHVAGSANLVQTFPQYLRLETPTAAIRERLSRLTRRTWWLS
jgi:hypothetical protein